LHDGRSGQTQPTVGQRGGAGNPWRASGSITEPGEEGGKLRFILGFAFPYCDDLKAGLLQSGAGAFVSLLIPGELCQPELAIPLRNRGSFASFMMVPKAAVHENGPASCTVGDVWAARQISVVDPKALAEAMEFTADDQFRFRPALRNSRKSR
jgi:hypothetical protein